VDGWYLEETHLHIGMSRESIPHTRNGNPRPGQFDHSRTFHLSSGVQRYQFEVPLHSVTLDPGDCLYVAAHAAVVLDSDGDGEPEQRETAWAGGTRFVDQGNWATYFTYCLCDDGDVGGGVGCETAFAYSESNGTCFLDIDDNGDGTNDFDRWGWTIGKLSEGYYAFELVAGAGQCENGTHVGTLFVDYVDGAVVLNYQLDSPYALEDAHAYVGDKILPRDVTGNFTVAPGQYPYSTEGKDSVITVDDPTFLDDIHVVAHARVCGF
jgi:hypothetical protein